MSVLMPHLTHHCRSEPRKDHAVIMAYFARDCVVKMGIACRKLETQLGPGKTELKPSPIATIHTSSNCPLNHNEDTGDLRLRVGMHSGAVTGG